MDPQTSSSPQPSEYQVSRAREKKVRLVFWLALLVSLLLLGGVIVGLMVIKPVAVFAPTTRPEKPSTKTPKVTVQSVVSGLDHPWDIEFLPDGTAVFTQRAGTISTLKQKVATPIAIIDEVKAAGEGGLTGLAIDTDFASNHYIYTCYNTSQDIRVVRWKANATVTALTDKYPIVTGMPAHGSGRHSGCRMAFGPDGYLWIGTGDAAMGANPQNPKSLGGKILRVDRDGKAAPGNLGGSFDPRIFSYGHRNIQGIVFLPSPRGDIIGYSAEHGSSVDDEVNVLKKGNFGWDPDSGYTELGVPMTDKQKFPDAIDAYWSSGSPTQAPSGLAYIKGKQWKGWNGVLALAMLKAQHLKVLHLNDKGKIVKEERILEDRGRLRDATQAPDGSLYVTTDNGQGKDEILRLSPK